MNELRVENEGQQQHWKQHRSDKRGEGDDNNNDNKKLDMR